MTNVTFHKRSEVADRELKFAVLAARYKGKWVFCRHKDRTTWECPGGHREAGESIEETARRELWEETGAVQANIIPVCVYKAWDYGLLCYADILELEKLPKDSEISERCLSSALPENLTYQGIHDKLFARVLKWLDNDG